jgi:hypothetical protein
MEDRRDKVTLPINGCQGRKEQKAQILWGEHYVIYLPYL